MTQSSGNTFLWAQTYLQSNSSNKNIINDIEEFLTKWIFKSQYDLRDLNEDFNNVITAIETQYFGNKNDFKIFESIHCLVHNLAWDNLKSIIRAQYAQEDENLYEKSQVFCKERRTPVESGDTSYCFVPYTAAIVELSMWDSYNSPLEKLNCLYTTYDIIFAELKSALVTVISKYSEKELELPIINNEDLSPIILLVIMKSKLKYPFSNLMYINTFGQQFLKDNNKRYILKSFESVIKKLLKDQELFKLKSGSWQSNCIDFREVLEKMTLDETKKRGEPQVNPSLQEENRKRLLSLIFTSTSNDMNG